MASNRKMAEYNKGRLQGLEMAHRLLTQAGDKKGADVIEAEIRRRNMTPIKLAVTTKELAEALLPIRRLIHEEFTCTALMTLHDEFGFGKGRCNRFLNRLNLKMDCVSADLVDWNDMVQAVKDEIGIDVPTACMREEGLLR